MGGSSIPLAVLWGRRGFGCSFDWSLWQGTLGSLLQMVQFSPAPLRAGLGAVVQSCPAGSPRALPAASPSRSIHFPFCWRTVCTTHTDSPLSVLAAGFPFRNYLSSSVCENHNQGKFLVWTVRQTHTHKKTQRMIWKKSPKLHSPATQWQMERRVATACTRQHCDVVFSEVSQEHLPHLQHVRHLIWSRFDLL